MVNIKAGGDVLVLALPPAHTVGRPGHRWASSSRWWRGRGPPAARWSTVWPGGPQTYLTSASLPPHTQLYTVNDSHTQAVFLMWAPAAAWEAMGEESGRPWERRMGGHGRGGWVGGCQTFTMIKTVYGGAFTTFSQAMGWGVGGAGMGRMGLA